MSIKERLLCYCKERHTTIGTFCRHAGISSSYFNNVKGDIGKEIQVRIANTYKDLNVEWLRTGEGEMLIANNPPVQAATMTPHPTPFISTGNVTGSGNAFVAGNNNAVNASPDVVVAEVTPTGEVSIINQPPVVPDSVARRPNFDLMEWVESDESEHAQHIFNISEILRKTKFIIKTTNNAMAPTLFQNEFVFMKPMPVGMLITDGDIYGIDTTHRGMLIRHLYDKGEYYLARPKNQQEYGDVEIPKNEVLRKYIILFHGSTQMSSMPSNEAERDKQIQQQGEQINALIDQLGDSMEEISRAGARTDRLIEQNTVLMQKLIEN